ncbi:hypothetical protein [Streptomyces canus]|uniref:hypothetical protein n=1 Tax=Streptomyces canus TaxID=58343 RepID=UPI00370FBECE
MDRKTIKAKLRELAADPGQPGAAAEVQRLKGALRRLTRTQSAEPIRAREREPEPVPDGLTEADAEAIETWPPELRARLNESAFSRVVDRASSASDPDNWGVKNDLRRRGARP